MLNCMGTAQQPKVLTPLWTPGAGVRPWLVSTLPMPASSCQVSAGQVWAAWIYRPRYPDGISASAKALASTVGPGGMPAAAGADRGGRARDREARRGHPAEQGEDQQHGDHSPAGQLEAHAHGTAHLPLASRRTVTSAV